MNIYVIETTEDLLWLKLYGNGQIKVVFYDVVRPFELDDFPETIETLHIRYCMIEQRLCNLPTSIIELGFYHNMDNIEELDVPQTVRCLSFSVCVSQKLLDNLPPWIQSIYIYYKSLLHYEYSNMPVGLQHLYFEFIEESPHKLDQLPPGTRLVVNKSKRYT